MPSFEVHCEKTKEVLGNPYESVHVWLDEKFEENIDHRQFRHTLKSVQEKFKGDELKAALLHIDMDIDGIPIDTDDYLYGDWTKWKHYSDCKTLGIMQRRDNEKDYFNSRFLISYVFSFCWSCV